MKKWMILATCCLAFSAASADECNEPITSTDDVSVEAGQGISDESQAPSLFNKNEKDKSGGGGCGCGGKPKQS